MLRAAGVPLRLVPEVPGAEGVVRKIGAVAAALSLDGAALADTVATDWRALGAPVAALRPLRALFVLSVARGAPLVSGEGTHAEAMLRAAGAMNVIRGFTGYRPLWAEAAATLAPEAIVMMEHALAEGGGAEAIFRIPALAVTPAAAARRVGALDGSYMLGFRPRAAHARRDLVALLHPRATLPVLPGGPGHEREPRHNGRARLAASLPAARRAVPGRGDARERAARPGTGDAGRAAGDARRPARPRAAAGRARARCRDPRRGPRAARADGGARRRRARRGGAAMQGLFATLWPIPG